MPTNEQKVCVASLQKKYALRLGRDGVYWHPRPHPKMVEELNASLKQLASNRWVVDYNVLHKSFMDLPKISKVVNIVGKGPSLDCLPILKGDIIGINEAANTLKKLGYNPYMVVTDAGPIEVAEGLTVIAAEQAKHCYPGSYVFNRRELGVSDASVTALSATVMAKKLGAEEIIFYAFDASITGDSSYAKSVGYQPTNDTGHYVTHRNQLTALAEKIGIKISFHECLKPDTPQQLLDSPQERDDHYRDESPA